MSQVQVEDPVWKAIFADEKLARARRVLSLHEIRLIVKHAQTPHFPQPCFDHEYITSGCPDCGRIE